MKRLKKHFRLIILIMVAVGGVLAVSSGYLPFARFWDDFRPKGEESISTEALQPKRTDKLFTAFVYMPIIDFKPEGENNSNNIRGVCSRQYTVEFGYNDTLQLFNEYREAACRNDLEAMPNPVILASKPEFVERKGEYSQKDCDSFDEKKNELARQESHNRIWRQLTENGQGSRIASNSRRILADYLRIYCPVTAPDK